MDFRERYKQSFSVLQPSRAIDLKEKNMNSKQAKMVFRPAVAVAICAVVALGTGTVAYAADFGGFRSAIQLWMGGEPIEATIIQDPNSEIGHYEVLDEDGNVVMGGGGVSVDMFGNERPATMEEIQDELSNYVDRTADGRVWLHESQETYDITDLMASGKCNIVVPLKDGSAVYYEIEDQDGMAYAYERTLEPKLPTNEYVELEMR